MENAVARGRCAPLDTSLITVLPSPTPPAAEHEGALGNGARMQQVASEVSSNSTMRLISSLNEQHRRFQLAMSLNDGADQYKSFAVRGTAAVSCPPP